MSLKRILAILGKDLRDAFRDGRVAVLLILPIALAVFYNQTVKDEDDLPSVKVAIADPQDRGLGRQLERLADRSVEVKAESVGDERAARKALDDDADVGVVVRPGSGGTEAEATVLIPGDADPEAQGLAALVPDALTRAVGRTPAVQVQTDTVQTDQKAFDRLGQRTFTVLITLVLLAGFVALIVVPLQTAEELETGTFGALRLAVTGPEVLAAKALAGLLYILVGFVLTALLTGLDIDQPVQFVGAAFALGISLVGFGVLLGLLVPNTTTINTYASFLLIPVIGLAVAAFVVDGGVIDTICDVLPFSQASRLLGDSLTSASLFDGAALSWLVVVLWSAAGLALLVRVAARREL